VLGPSIEAGSKDEVKSMLRDAALTWVSEEQECEEFLDFGNLIKDCRTIG
jgi:hypothetical protein